MAKKKLKQTEFEMENVNLETGEIISERGKLNEVIVHETVRPDGTRKVSFDYSNCPTMAEQHTAHLSDINYLMEKYQPDELAAYIAARGAYKREILGHDFSQEPSLQEALNMTYQIKQHFNELPEDVRIHFRSPSEFMKFIDNPANAEKMLKLGLLTPQEIKKITEPVITNTETAPDSTKA